MGANVIGMNLTQIERLIEQKSNERDDKGRRRGGGGGGNRNAPNRNRNRNQSGGGGSRSGDRNHSAKKKWD